MHNQDYEINDPTFVEDLIESKDTVWFAARWLSDADFTIRIPPTRVRPSVAQMAEYSDKGDLFISKPSRWSGEEKRIEVKKRDLSFTGKHDFPFNTIIVDVKHKIDKADPKPHLYLAFNSTLTCCCITKGDTHESWATAKRWDERKGRLRTFYECPINLCTFKKVSVSY
jgi:hypothetical protein